MDLHRASEKSYEKGPLQTENSASFCQGALPMQLFAVDPRASKVGFKSHLFHLLPLWSFGRAQFLWALCEIKITKPASKDVMRINRTSMWWVVVLQVLFHANSAILCCIHTDMLGSRGDAEMHRGFPSDHQGGSGRARTRIRECQLPRQQQPGRQPRSASRLIALV